MNCSVSAFHYDAIHGFLDGKDNVVVSHHAPPYSSISSI